MVSFTYIALTLATAVSAASVDPIQVFEDLQSIDKDTVAFNTTLTQWNGQILYALGLETAQLQIQQDINQTSTDVAALNTTISEVEAQAAIAYINGQLQPDVVSTFANLVSRKADFETNNLTQFVVSGLTQFESSAKTLGDSLVAKAPADLQAQAKASAAQFTADFANALKAFTS